MRSTLVAAAILGIAAIAGGCPGSRAPGTRDPKPAADAGTDPDGVGGGAGPDRAHTEPRTATAADCEAAVDHIFALLREDPDTTPEQRTQLEDRRAAAEDAMVQECLREMTPEQFRCILAQTTIDGLRTCEQPKAKKGEHGE